MTACEKIQALLPWVVNGSLRGVEARRAAAHLSVCPDCREELAVTLRLAGAVREAFSRVPALSEDGWNGVARRLPTLPSARLDLGSFLVGLSMGMSLARDGRPRVRSDLQILGRKMRLFDTRKGG